MGLDGPHEDAQLLWRVRPPALLQMPGAKRDRFNRRAFAVQKTHQRGPCAAHALAPAGHKESVGLRVRHRRGQSRCVRGSVWAECAPGKASRLSPTRQSGCQRRVPQATRLKSFMTHSHSVAGRAAPTRQHSLLTTIWSESALNATTLVAWRSAVTTCGAISCEDWHPVTSASVMPCTAVAAGGMGTSEFKRQSSSASPWGHCQLE